MDLLEQLTNQRFAGVAEKLAEAAQGNGKPWRPSWRQPRRARFGSVERAVLEAVALADEPLSVRQVAASIADRTGATMNYGSIKAALAKLAQGPKAALRRVDRGRYGKR